ncbi:MAG: DUF2442 domain-containing protein [Cytophagaceae bacterium]|nr:DUF2442 domain-containing protein [Cytophagaceae bacterium]
MSKRLKIIRARDAGNLRVKLWFSDETEQVVDIGEFIRNHPHPAYNRFLDADLFKTFQLDNGNIVWGEDWDLIFPVYQLHRGIADGDVIEQER